MAHEEYTGKSAGTAITYGGASIPTGWHMITITENGKPRPGQIDKTHAGDSAYSFMDDPLGGEGQANCTVEVEGFMSETDHQDSGILASTFDDTGDVIVTTKALGDKFTATGATWNGLDVGAGFADVQPYKLTFTLASSAGAWSTAV